jgi:hypothetical protein
VLPFSDSIAAKSVPPAIHKRMLSLLASNISTKNINTQNKHTTSAQRNKSQVQSMDSEAKDFTYTTDQQNWLLHKRKIDAGGYGDVHEVTTE